KVFGEHEKNFGHGGAEHLADADLFSALFCDIGREPEQAQTGNEDGESREDAREPAYQHLQLEFGGIVLILKMILEQTAGVVPVENGLDRSQSSLGADVGGQPEL